MRTVTAPETTLLQGRVSAHALKIEIQDAAAAWVDYSAFLAMDWQDRCEITCDVNQRVAEATVEIGRSTELGSLSPLMNTEIATGRRIRISGSRVAVGSAASWKMLFQGRIDRVDWTSDPMKIVARDDSGELVDRWIETPDGYGAEGGQAIEEVMQDILDDWLPSWTLYTPVSPGFMVLPYDVEPQSVESALWALADLIGWVIEYRWDNGTGAFRLTFYEPDRDPAATQFTFGPDDYYDVTRLDEDSADVRNAITVRYRDAATEEKVSTAIEDPVSIAKFGRQWAQFEEADDSPIDTLAEATALITAALADLKDPVAEQEIETDLFWPIQLGDFYEFLANGVHYGADQEWGVTGYTHVFENGRALTRIQTRGKPVGHVQGWLQRETTLDEAAEPGRQLSIVGVQASADPAGMGLLTVTLSDAPQSFVARAKLNQDPSEAEILAQGTVVDTPTLQRSHTVQLGRGNVGDTIHFGVIAFAAAAAGGQRTPISYARAPIAARPLNAAPRFDVGFFTVGTDGTAFARLIEDPDGTMLPYDEHPDGAYVTFRRVDTGAEQTQDLPVTVAVSHPEYRNPTAYDLTAGAVTVEPRVRYRWKDDEFKELVLERIILLEDPAAELPTAPVPIFKGNRKVAINFHVDDDTGSVKYIARRSAPFPDDAATRATVLASGTTVTVPIPGTRQAVVHHTTDDIPEDGGSYYLAAVPIRTGDSVAGALRVTGLRRDSRIEAFVVRGTADEARVGELVNPFANEPLGETPPHLQTGRPRVFAKGTYVQAFRFTAKLGTEPDFDYDHSTAVLPELTPDGWLASTAGTVVVDVATGVPAEVMYSIGGQSERWPNTAVARELAMFLFFQDVLLAGPNEALSVVVWPMDDPLGETMPGQPEAVIIYGPDAMLRVPIAQWLLAAGEANAVPLDLVNEELAALGLAGGDVVEAAVQLRSMDVGGNQPDLEVTLQVVYYADGGTQLGVAFTEVVESSDATEIGANNARFIVAVPAHRIPAGAFRVRLIIDWDILAGAAAHLRYYRPAFYIRPTSNSGDGASAPPNLTTYEQAVAAAAQAAAQPAGAALDYQGTDEDGNPTLHTALRDVTNTTDLVNAAGEITDDAGFGTGAPREVLDVNQDLDATIFEMQAPRPGAIVTLGMIDPGDGNYDVVTTRGSILSSQYHSVGVPFKFNESFSIDVLGFRTGDVETGGGAKDIRISVYKMSYVGAGLWEPSQRMYLSAALDPSLDNTLYEHFGFTPIEYVKGEVWEMRVHRFDAGADDFRLSLWDTGSVRSITGGSTINPVLLAGLFAITDEGENPWDGDDDSGESPIKAPVMFIGRAE